MKKILSVIVVVVVTLTQTAQITAFAQETDKPAVNAQACVLYCVDDGKVYFSVNENKKMNAIFVERFVEQNNSKII